VPLAALCALSACSGPSPPALERVRAHGVLRVVTLNAPTTWYQGTHGDEGIEYTLASQFAQRLGVRLEIVAVADRNSLCQALMHGKADVAAAQISFGPRWRKCGIPAASFDEVRQFWVYRRGQPRPGREQDLAGRRIAVAEDSPEAIFLDATAAGRATRLRWNVIPRIAGYDALDAVGTGRSDVTLVDGNELAFARPLHPELAVAFADARSRPVQWLVPKGAADLQQEVDAFFASEAASGRIRQTLARALAATRGVDVRGARDFRAHVAERLPDLQSHFERAAAQAGIDWRLLAALAYQESQWDPRAESPNGAQGLMMLMPETAASLGVTRPFDPVQSVLAGARYFAKVLEQIPARIPEPDRSWFAIASYNMGYGHLEDARVITQARGGDPDRWADVGPNLPLLSEEYWYLRAKHGYARGWEAKLTVERVRQFANILEWRTTARHADADSATGTALSASPESAGAGSAAPRI
jgi:membrane-bound lytic murein transglycosylase F